MKKHIVTFGGGTGTYVVLTALKDLHGVQLTAIVSGADDGGSTGHLRDAYGFLPAGDVRQALVALSPEWTMLRKLFNYRFSKGNLAGHSLGNLFLTALADIMGSDTEAIEEASRILRVSGRVVSATDTPAVLTALLADGTRIKGEHEIDEREKSREKITELSYDKPLPLAKRAHDAIVTADLVVLGPGDLYTSTIAAVLPQGTAKALVRTNVRIVYVVNLFTKLGQTTDFTASEHVETLARYIGKRPDLIVVHQGTFPPEVISKYEEEGEKPVVDDLEGEGIIRADIASIHSVPAVEGDPVPRSLVRHDPEKLATVLEKLL